MYDASFSARSLMYVFRKQDFHAFGLDDIEEVKLKLQDAEAATQNIANNLQFNVAHTKGRSILFPKDYTTEIIIRKANANIKKILNVSSSTRNDIIRHLKELFKEGVPYVVGRYDIKRFYENIKVPDLIKKLDKGLSNTYETRRLVSAFLTHHDSVHSNGLPTGISLSATLAEFYLREFDSGIRALPWVRYFARYVDDIIIVADPSVDAQMVEAALIGGLPEGLSLNTGEDKRYFRKLGRDSTQTIPEADFDYLGYRFRIGQIRSKSSACQTLAAREVRVDISAKKVKIRKSRFMCSVRQYIADGNFNDLRDRFRILNSGQIFYDKNRSVFRRTGIMYSYPHIDFPSEALASINNLYKTIFTKRTGGICRILSLSPLSRRERKYFNSHSLEKNVLEGVHINFSADEVLRLMGCWKHV